MSSSTIRILVADAHPLSQGVISDLLSQESDLEIVGNASTGEELLALVQRSGARVVLLEERLGGLELVQALREIDPNLGTIVFSARDCTDYLQAALVLGDDSHLHKQRIARLAPAIRLVSAGGIGVAPLQLLALVLD